MKKVSVWRDFVFFCLTFLFSAFGFEFLFFVMTVHIYDLSKNVLNVSIFIVINYVPKLFSPYLGALTDRFNKQKIFSIITIITAILALLLSLTSNLTIIYLVWSLISVLLTLIVNIRSTLMADVMSNERYTLGNTVTLVLSNSAKLLAPLLGGFTLIILDFKIILFFIAIIYILTAIFSRFINLQKMNGIDNKDITNKAGTIKETLSYISTKPIILFLAILGSLWSLFLGFRVSVYVGYIEDTLSSPESYYGIFLTFIGLGSIIGSILGTYLSKFIKHQNIMVIGLSMHFITFSLLGLVNNIKIAIVIACISHIGLYMAVVGLHTLRDKGTSSLIRGRVYGLVTAILTPASIISTLVAGLLSTVLGLRPLFIGAGILALVGLYLLLIIIKPSRTVLAKNSFS